MSLFHRRVTTVAILGCGPAGLFAAEAAALAGKRVLIFSKKRKSEMFGAQYLHAPIPGLSEDIDRPQSIQYILQGTLEGYARKVYGPEADSASVSPASLVGINRAWNIRSAYDMAWSIWGPQVIDTQITKEWLLTAAPAAGPRVAWVWSIPLEPFCLAGHTFASRQVYAKGDAPERGVFCPVSVAPGTVVCNGEDSPGWYRASNVFGYRSAEWPGDRPPPVADLSKVTKPIFTNCTCWQDLARAGNPTLRVGRYGRWEKGELAHQAYERVRAWLK